MSRFRKRQIQSELASLQAQYEQASERDNRAFLSGGIYDTWSNFDYAANHKRREELKEELRLLEQQLELL